MLADFIVTDFHTWSFGHVLVAIVILAAAVAIVVVALRRFNISPPDWVVQIFWIVVVCVVAVVAIKFVLGLL